MIPQELMSIIAVAIVLNAVLIVLALVKMRAPRMAPDAAPGPVQLRAPDVEHDATMDAIAAHELLPAMVASIGNRGPSAASFRTHDPLLGEFEGSNGSGTSGNGSSADTDAGLDPALAPEPTNLEAPAAWRRAVDEETIRLARYKRPATVMFLELDGFERLRERLGDEAGTRLVVATAKAIRAQARAADRCAHYARGRFAILLPETDDIAAINFAERIRSECDRWLEAGAVAMRVAIGWASLDATSSDATLAEAERRMHADRRHRVAPAAETNAPASPRRAEVLTDPLTS